MHTLTVETHRHTQFIPLDRELSRIVREMGIQSGLLHLHVPHTTAGITINENADPDVLHDIELALERAVPWHAPGYLHGEGNSAAHVKASMMGAQLSVPIINGALRLGTWQSVFFCEFDGPRVRQVWITPIPLQHGT